MRTLKAVAAGIAVATAFGCATSSTSQPIAYLAVEKPKGVIQTAKPQALNKEFSRGGWYIGNYNFRPAAEVNYYLAETHKQANSAVLRNADLELKVPFALDLLFCGYNWGTDEVLLKAEGEAPPAAK